MPQIVKFEIDNTGFLKALSHAERISIGLIKIFRRRKDQVLCSRCI